MSAGFDERVVGGAQSDGEPASLEPRSFADAPRVQTRAPRSSRQDDFGGHRQRPHAAGVSDDVRRVRRVSRLGAVAPRPHDARTAGPRERQRAGTSGIQIGERQRAATPLGRGRARWRSGRHLTLDCACALLAGRMAKKTKAAASDGAAPAKAKATKPVGAVPAKAKAKAVAPVKPLGAALAGSLANATRAAFQRLRAEHPGERFYFFGLFTTADGSYVTCLLYTSRCV